MDNRDLMNYNRNRIETEISLVKNPTMGNRGLINYNRNGTDTEPLVNIG
jgi:hypothetical protein